MSILKTLRKWVTGKSDEDDKKKKRDALRVTNYGGGAARNDTKGEVKRSIQKAEKAKTQATTSLSAFKATPPSVKKAESKDKQTKPTQSSAFKAGNTDPKQELAKTSKERLQKQRDTQLAKKNARQANQKEKSRAADKLKPLMDEKYSTRKAGVPTYVKQGNYAADPLVAKYNVLKHPVATSATRGAVNATTLGLSDLAISKLSKGEAKEAEQFYQANKNKVAETAGQLIGGLGMYGSTAGSFENLGAKAVGRAAETQLGKRLGAEALARTMAGTGAKAAIARSLVGDTIQDSTMGLVDTLTGVAQRDDLETAGDYLKAIAEGQALNYGMGLAGNAVSHALPVARRAWGNFADESRRLHIVPPSVADIAGKTEKYIDNSLSADARTTLRSEADALDNEYWDIAKSIEDDYGTINPNYRELTSEQQADVIAKKTRMREINARKNEIHEDLRIVRERPVESGVENTKATTPKIEEVGAEPTAKTEVKANEPPKAETKAKTAKAEKKPKAKKEPKSKAKTSIADVKTYAEFVESNKKNADVIKRIKAGENPKDIWQNARIEKGRGDIRLTSLSDAKKALYDYIPENEVQGWFNDANSGYKPKIVERIAENPDALNASLNVAYRNYLDTDPKSVMSFDEWVDTPQTYYRGTRGQTKTDDDVFSGFTPRREVAEKFAGKGGKVDEITIAPRQTYGSIMTNGESEILVPESEIKQYAKEIKTSKSDPLKAYKEKRLKENPNATFKEVKKEIEPETKAEVKEAKAEVKAETPKAEPKKAKAQKATTQKAAEPSPKAEPAKTTKTKTETKATKTKGKKAEKATQESFDKDFADFRKTIGNAKTDLYELENKLRVAESKEDKKAIREQIKKLKDDVKAAHKKAGLRYHPDRGGSDEWMAKFNEAYEAFEKGGNNKPPTGKPPKPTRTVEKVEDIVNKTKKQKSAKEDVKNAMQTARRKSTNSLVTFEDENLKTIKSDNEGWKRRNASVDKTRRSNALANRSVNETQLQADGTRYGGTVERIGADGKTYKIQNGKSLTQIYSGMDDKTEAAFDAYLLLRHAPDRIREGTPIFDAINLKAKNGEVIRSLNDPTVVKEEAERLLKEHPEFAQKAEEIYQYTHNELENRVKKGLLSQKKASEWMHDHPFYVPTGRDGYFNAVHGGHKGVIGADPYKAAKGSDLDIRSIKEQLAEATARNWRDITSNELLEEFFGSKIKAGGNNTKGLALLNETIGLSKSADGRKFYAKIWRDGKMHRVEIDKNFYDDLEDLYKNGSVGAFGDMVARATSKVSSPFKKLVTSWNPIFLPKNFSRDMQDALINSRQTKEFVECLKPAWDELKFGGEYARAFEDSGVSQANFVNLEEALNRGGKLGKAVDKFVALQDMTESFPRLAEYMATLKKAGVDITKPLASQNVDPKLLDIAAANAADVTVNFSRSGSVGKNLNKGLVPFLNPSIQGWSKFVRNFREQRGLPQLLGTIAKASMLGAGTVAVNNFLLSDNPNYQQISAREKANNIIIAWPPFKTDKDGLHINNDADVFVKIPRGRFAAVYGLATLNSNNENDMGWLEMLKVARDQVLPVDPTESSIVAPLYAAAKNETWYGAPIESDYLVDNFSPSERYDERTTPLGKALGKATSGLPEELQISPKKFDYMADAATGVVGDFALPISTAVGNAISNKSSVVDASADAGVGVLKKAFTIDSATQSGLYSKYNDKATRLTHKKNSANATEADKKAADRFNSWDERVKAASNAMRYVQNSDMPNKQDAYRELAKLRNENMQKAIDGKVSLNNTRDINTIHKYAGTSYTIENLGKAADKKALKIYSAAVYGDLSEKKMREKIDSDTEFYKGYEGILKTQNALQRVNPKLKGNNALAYAVGLANAGANDDVFASYDTTIKSRTESASKSQRAKDYFKNSGSIDEFAQLENVVKTYGKVSDVDKDRLEDEAFKKLQRKEISMDDYQTELDKIAYNANQSYVGKAVSLAQSGAPARAYNLYDIKDKNVQKGYNLAVMGIDSRKYREMSKACDTDGNGYLKTAEIKAYVDKSDIKDKATLFDALCYYPNVRNPYGTPKQYSAKDAAEAGKRDGVAQIKANEGKDNTKFVEASSGNSGGYYGYRGYYGGRWRRWGRRGGSGGSSAKMNQSAFKAKKISVKGGAKAVKSPSSQSSSGSKATYKSLATSLKKSSGSRSSSNSNKVSVKYDTASAVKKPTTKKTATKATPPKVKFKKYEV